MDPLLLVSFLFLRFLSSQELVNGLEKRVAQLAVDDSVDELRAEVQAAQDRIAATVYTDKVAILLRKAASNKAQDLARRLEAA
mgnify:CR=1 FL=1